MVQNKENHIPHIVIIGAGFGGLSAAKALKKTKAKITVIDKHNYHLFQPLLYQVATAGLSPADIASPIRGVLRENKNASTILDTVTGIDKDKQLVMTEAGREIAYDYLIIATGATHGYFGKGHWEKYAPGIKTIDDATNVRRKILMAFEQAEMASDEETRKAFMNFTIVGGGPTGVELAGAIAELARHTLKFEFSNIKPEDAQIRLIDAGDRVLKAFPEKLAKKAQKTLETMGVELVFNTRVEDVSNDYIIANGEKWPCYTVIWAAGVQASPASKWLNMDTDHTGRVPVGQNLNIEGYDNIFVVGDTAAHTPDGKEFPLPGVAPVAKQMGVHAAKVINASIKEKTLKPFKYSDLGSMATIGRKSAVCNFYWTSVTGYLGWWLWGFAHIYFLIGFRNRFIVGANWFWNYLTFQRGIRLITGDKMVEEELLRSKQANLVDESEKAA